MSKTIPVIEEIKLSDLIIDISLSGRTEKEIDENAKSLAPLMEASGGWDAHQPGEYFIRDGKKHLAAGFTRTAATKMNGWKTGFFVQVEDNPEKLRTACIRTNAGKPISAFEQGRKYAEMRDGTNPESTGVGQPVFAAMKTADIAKEVGYTRQHIEQCIAVFESSPEIAELILSGKVSPNVVVRAKQLVKDEGKQLKFIKAAIKQADADGKECATMKHLDAVRPEFAPLKAKTSPQPETPPIAPQEDGSGNSDNGDDPAHASDDASAGEPESDMFGGAPDNHNQAPQPDGNSRRKEFIRRVEMWSQTHGVPCDEADIIALVDDLLSIG